MAYTKQTWNDLPNTTTPITAERLNHIEDGVYDVSTTTATTSVDGLMSSGDKTHLNRIGITALLSSAITTKNQFTLNASVDSFDFIIVFATANQYNHRHVATLLRPYLFESTYQLIQFDETHYDNNIVIWSNKISTNSSTLIGTASYKISQIYGIKIS